MDRKLPVPRHAWVAPPVGIVKINVDPTLTIEGWVGIGVVARDSNGGVFFCGFEAYESLLGSGNN